LEGLQEHFLQKNGPRLFQLRKDFITYTQGNLSVGAYYPKIKGLWEELAEFRPISISIVSSCQIISATLLILSPKLCQDLCMIQLYPSGEC
jgi:hypothetical protein